MKTFEPYIPKTLEYTETKNGKLRGFKLKGIYSFFNIPYGECKRWQAATPAKPWKGIRNAVQFGPRMFPGATSPAGIPVFTPWDSCGVAHEAYDYAEDALNLNVWTPSIDKTAKKPVMVWIHGGGYSTGSAMEMQCHHGANLAQFGDVVVVNLNHRLNIFGFMDMSRFGEEYANSGNAGLSDLVLALQWVHDNIEAFGGDPDNVMIFGQSGGGQKVTSLLQIPAADGLFHKAVVMSGVNPYPLGGEPVVKEDAERSNLILDLLLKKFNTDSIEPLLALEPEELLEAYFDIVPELEAQGFAGRSWTGIAGDYYVGDPFAVGFTEHAKTVPVMVGCTTAEMPLMRVFNKHDYTEAQQMDILRECFPGQDVDKLAEEFKKAWPGKCLTDAIEMSGRMEVRRSVIRYSDQRAQTCSAPTYTYLLAHDFPQEGGRGPWHCADLPIVFHNSAEYPENFHQGLLEGLEDAMCGAWVNFARYSNPNNNYLNLEWPEYKTGECATMVFDDECKVGYDFDRSFVDTRRAMKLEVNDKYTKFTQLVN